MAKFKPLANTLSSRPSQNLNKNLKGWWQLGTRTTPMKFLLALPITLVSKAWQLDTQSSPTEYRTVNGCFQYGIGSSRFIWVRLYHLSESESRTIFLLSANHRKQNVQGQPRSITEVWVHTVPGSLDSSHGILGSSTAIPDSYNRKLLCSNRPPVSRPQPFLPIDGNLRLAGLCI